MKFGMNDKPTDDIVSDMGDDAGKYGADMEDSEEPDEGSDDEEKEDRMMAVKELGRALGVTVADPDKAAQALETFVKSCR